MTDTRDLAEAFGTAIIRLAHEQKLLEASTTLALEDLTIRLDFASKALSQLLLPAFDHLPCDDTRPSALNVKLWEPQLGGHRLPAFPWPDGIYRGCGEIPGFSDGRIYLNIDVQMKTLTVLDIEAGDSCFVSQAPELLPTYECAGPLRWLIHRFAVERDMALVHAGAVSSNGRAAVIVGPRGAGKSTTALASVAYGLSYLGDDRCLLKKTDNPLVLSLYCSAKILRNEFDRHQIPGLHDAVVPTKANEQKIVLNLSKLSPSRFARSAELACILVPRPNGETRSRLIPISSAEAVRLLLSEIVGYSPVTAARSLAILSDICSRRPTFRLEAGTNLLEVGETVSAAIDLA